MVLLEVKNLNLGFQSENNFYQALYDVSFSVKKGNMLAIVGESGCGKTMSAMSILQLIPKTARITSGGIFFNGENMLNKSKGENAYTMLDINSDADESIVGAISAIDGVRRVRVITF